MNDPLALEINQSASWKHASPPHNGSRVTLPGLAPVDPGEAPARPDEALVREIREAVAARLEVAATTGSRIGDDAAHHARVGAFVHEEVGAWAARRARAGRPPVSISFERELAQVVIAALAGLGALKQLLDDDRVENVHIHGCDQVFLELADGSMQRWPYPVAETDAALVEMLADLAARMGQTAREFSPASPMLNLRLPAGGVLGSRLAAVIEVSDRPRVAIRRHRLTEATLDDLADKGTVDDILVAFFRAAVGAGKNVFITGGPYAGKTTFLRALGHEIPAREHVVTVEDDYELGLHLVGNHPVVTPLEARTPNAEGAGEIILDDLLKQALRHSPSRVIVGEVRAGEVTSMLRALGNGAAGGMCTMHARSAAAAFDRIAALGQLARPPLSIEAAYRWTASAINIIAHVVKVDDTDKHGTPRRQRFVSEVIEVGPIGDSGRPDVTRLFAPRRGDGRAVPAFVPSPGLLADLERAGFDRALLEHSDGTWLHTDGESV